MQRRTARAMRSKAPARPTKGSATGAPDARARAGGRHGGGRRGGSVLRGLGVGLRAQEAGEVRANIYQVAQRLAVLLLVRGGLAGFVVTLGLGRVCGHERNKNIVGVRASSLMWTGRSRGAAATSFLA